MKVINCWEIQVWDGGDRHNHKCYVASNAAAYEWLTKNKYDVIHEKEFVILDSLEELEEYKNRELRKKALAKLTTAERKALGV